MRVIVAWGKNCREESDKFLPLTIRLVKGSDSNPTYLDSDPPHLSQYTTSTDLICHNLWPLSVFKVKQVIVTDCNTEHEQTGYKTACAVYS